MKLAYWMYAGPAHIGTLRITSSFRNVHAVMHAPLGDDYFNVMRSMLERKRDFTPVTASIVDRHVLAQGSPEKVVNNIIRKDIEEKPDLIVLTPTCTSSILQEDLQNFVKRASFETNAPVLLADVNHYRFNELQAADRTLEQIIQFYLSKAKKKNQFNFIKTNYPSVNIIGAVDLGFHNQHDIAELKRFFSDLNIKINEIIPEGASVRNLKNLPQASFNFVPYREVGLLAAKYLEKEFNMPYIDITPMGIIEITRCIRKIQRILQKQNFKVNFEKYIDIQTRFVSQSTWFSRSIDCQNLTGKEAVVFGDATHVVAMTKILVNEMGIKVVWAGSYCTNHKEWMEKEISTLCNNLIFTEDHNLIANLISKSNPSAIFGTQMERHIGKRLNIPCGVISAPVHIQNFPLSYRPFLGYEGTNQIADLIYNCFTLGMEDHLLEIFGGHEIDENHLNSETSNKTYIKWLPEAIEELNKMPNFVRKKVKLNTEKFAEKNNISKINVETMFLAKQYFNTI